MNEPVAGFVTEALAAQADPERAGPMAAYMKTDMAFYGVAAPARKAVVRDAARTFPPADDAHYRRQVALYARAVERATGQPARGVLLYV